MNISETGLLKSLGGPSSALREFQPSSDTSPPRELTVPTPPPPLAA